MVLWEGHFGQMFGKCKHCNHAIAEIKGEWHHETWDRDHEGKTCNIRWIKQEFRGLCDCTSPKP